MCTTKTFNKREINHILKNNGYKFHHQNGSHAIYKNDKGRHITIGLCKCNKMVMQRLIKEYQFQV